MALRYWQGGEGMVAGVDDDMDVAANWSGGVKPGTEDIAVFDFDSFYMSPALGSISVDIIQTIGTLQYMSWGGTFTANTFDMQHDSQTLSLGSEYACVVNGDLVPQMGGAISIYPMATINGNVDWSNGSALNGGTVNGNCTISYANEGTVNGDLRYISTEYPMDNALYVSGEVQHYSTSNGGYFIFYRPESDHVAPASTVLAGQNNLGIAGTLPLAHVMQSSGGNLLPTDVRDDTATGAAAGGALDVAADNPPLTVSGGFN